MSRILIVDDRHENLYMLRTLLTGYGYEVAEARHGAEALLKARQSPPLFVISDLLMPVMDGYTLLRHWKSDERLKHIPFIVYTATYIDSKDEKLALDLGADAFIIKPTEPELFIGRIREILAKHESESLSTAKLPTGNEKVQIMRYNESLIRKLEQKMLQLEQANRALEQDIAERRLTEKALRESEEKFRSLFQNHAAVKLIIDPEDGNIVDANQSAARFYGWPVDELCRMNISRLNSLPRAKLKEEIEKARNFENAHFEFKHRKANGNIVDVEVFSSKVIIGGKEYLHSIIHDITEKRQLENQLLQAQKMESVGQLAGGVAHDYNNILGAILGFTELALDKADTSSPLYDDLKEIHNVVVRSAEITRQLLAFARKQTISPRVLDLNETVASMLKILQRLIREDIDLVWLPGSDIWSVMVDPSQIDQILANLCVNARDAIVGVGKVTIRTDNVTLDAAYCALHADVVPGEFVLLEVSDNGCGMDKETLSHIFEPFYTTKDVGKGTGLGLATVYGIVKQNKGSIDIYSEPGKGTAFSIYLPRHADRVCLSEIRDETEVPKGHREIVLVVEDNISILNVVKRMLRVLDYTVLDAATPAHAVDLAKKYGAEIRLLLTDVVMPEMNGRELADRLKSFCPDLEVLYMSGYTTDIIAGRGILETGVSFIQKPFSLGYLAARVRETLG